MTTAGTRSQIPVTATVVMHVGSQYRASEKAVVEAAFLHHPGVVSVEANPVVQTATVHYHPTVTSVADVRRVAEGTGFACAGCNVPGCLCDPLHEPGRPEPTHDRAAVRRA